MLINKTKKDSSLCLLLELSRNYDGRIVIDVTRTASIRRNGGPPRSPRNGPSRYFPKKKELELFNIHFPVRTLKQDFKPNLIKIGEVRWPRPSHIARK